MGKKKQNKLTTAHTTKGGNIMNEDSKRPETGVLTNILPAAARRTGTGGRTS